MPSYLSENGRGPRVPFLIGVSGGTSSGKTSVCQEILKRLKDSLQLDDDSVAIISQDNFYKDLGQEEIDLAHKCLYNFDHPDAFDTKLMQKTLYDLAQNKAVCVPEYDFKSHSRLKGTFTKLNKCKVVLFEGILTFYHPEVRDMFNMKLFVDSDADTRLSRRVLRDISERGRELESVLSQYTTFVKPAFEEFCLPTKKYADVIIPRGAENTVAINLIVQHIRDILTDGLHISMHNGHHSEAIHCNGIKKPIPPVAVNEVANARPH